MNKLIIKLEILLQPQILLRLKCSKFRYDVAGRHFFLLFQNFQRVNSHILTSMKFTNLTYSPLQYCNKFITAAVI